MIKISRLISLLFKPRKKKILFVCFWNKHRSLTAEMLYKNDSRFEVQSAGVSSIARQQLNPNLLRWADFVFVMEEYHIDKIKKNFPVDCKETQIFNLNITDHYEYMDSKLMGLIEEKFEKQIKGC